MAHSYPPFFCWPQLEAVTQTCTDPPSFNSLLKSVFLPFRFLFFFLSISVSDGNPFLSNIFPMGQCWDIPDWLSRTVFVVYTVLRVVQTETAGRHSSLFIRER